MLLAGIDCHQAIVATPKGVEMVVAEPTQLTPATQVKALQMLGTVVRVQVAGYKIFGTQYLGLKYVI